MGHRQGEKSHRWYMFHGGRKWINYHKNFYCKKCAINDPDVASGAGKTFDVRVNGKKSAQLNLGGMSLQVFEKKGKPPTKSYLYQNISEWQETPKGSQTIAMTSFR